MYESFDQWWDANQHWLRPDGDERRLFQVCWDAAYHAGAESAGGLDMADDEGYEDESW